VNSHCPKWAARVKAESKAGRLRRMFPVAAGPASLFRQGKKLSLMSSSEDWRSW
jgi:hypothetical protein